MQQERLDDGEGTVDADLGLQSGAGVDLRGGQAGRVGAAGHQLFSGAGCGVTEFAALGASCNRGGIQQPG